MKLHNHVIIEPPRGRHIWYPRWFFHLHRGPEYGDGPILDGHLEFVLSKPTPEFGISLGVGTRGSETPWDGYFKVAGTVLYWGIQQGGGLAEKITQLWLNRLPDRIGAACLDNSCACPPYNPGATFKRHLGRNGETYQHRWEGREFTIRTYEGSLWLHLWTPKNAGHRAIANWRDRSVKLNPLDWLFGERRYWYDDVETAEFQVELPEGKYPVQVKLQRQRFGRPKLPGRHIKSWTVDVRADAGIPYCYDSSGGWKGDRVYGFAVNLASLRPDWQIDAKAGIESWVLGRRAESGFREAQPLEADR